MIISPKLLAYTCILGTPIFREHFPSWTTPTYFSSSKQPQDGVQFQFHSQFPRLNWIQGPEFWLNAIGPVLIHNKNLYSIFLETYEIRKSINWTTWTECIQLWICTQKCYIKLVISNGEAITFLGSLGHQRHVKGTKYKWIFVLWFLLLHCQCYVIQLPFILLCD